MRYMTAEGTSALRGKANRQANLSQRREKSAAVSGMSFDDVRIRYSPAKQGTLTHTQEGKGSAGSEPASERRGGTIQCTTSIQYTGQTYKYHVYSERRNPVTGKEEYVPSGIEKTETTGGTMHANLDPADSVKGSTPAGQESMMANLRMRYGYKGNGLVRGHLLNHDLGGKGIPENLFPITAEANHIHRDSVETPTKEMLYKGYDVVYKIEAKNESGGLSVGKERDCKDDEFNITVEAGGKTQSATLFSNLYRHSGDIIGKVEDQLPSQYDKTKEKQTRIAWHH